MAQGNVKWFNADKGYGFIEQEGGEDLFVHLSEVQGEGFKTLADGQPVSFTEATGKNGRQQATQVHALQSLPALTGRATLAGRPARLLPPIDGRPPRTRAMLSTDFPAFSTTCPQSDDGPAPLPLPQGTVCRRRRFQRLTEQAAGRTSRRSAGDTA